MPEDASPSGPVSLLSDVPAVEDLLDYDSYRDALVSIIEGLSAGQTLTIGVFGDWGSGKTTLLGMVRQRLRSRGHSSVWINVWQLENEEEIWGAFLQGLTSSIKKETGWLRSWLFNAGLLRRRVDWAAVGRRVPEFAVRSGIVAVPLYLSLSNLDAAAVLDRANAIPGAGTLVSAVAAWFLVLRPYVKEVRERVSVDFSGLLRSSSLKRRVSLLESFRRDFEDVVMGLVGRHGRLTVFVDDLDRCSPGKIVQILDAMKVFVEIPRCAFVIGLDREIIEQAIRTKYKDYENAAEQSRQYLEKLIGLPFDLPPLTDDGMEALVNGVAESLPDEEGCHRVFALGQEPNPRKVKRTINVFLLLWTLAQQRAELRNVIRPTRLAKIVVIQHSYRDLFKLLLREPQLIGDLEVYFRQPDRFRVEEGTGGGEETEDTTEGAPDDGLRQLSPALRPFLGNENLKRLLTLLDASKADLNFTAEVSGEYVTIPEGELSAYTQLTYAVDRQTVAERGGEAPARPFFLAYRRSDSAGHAGRILDRLRAEFGEQSVFADVEAIPAGVDFREYLSNVLRRAEALLVVIGPDWLGVGSDGTRAIDNPDDYIRSEIRTALQHDSRVIPLLVADAPMPSGNELPEDIAGLSYRQAAVISDSRFEADMVRLVSDLRSLG